MSVTENCVVKKKKKKKARKNTASKKQKRTDFSLEKGGTTRSRFQRMEEFSATRSILIAFVAKLFIPKLRRKRISLKIFPLVFVLINKKWKIIRSGKI